MRRLTENGRALAGLAMILAALIFLGIYFDRDSRARMDALTARIEAEAAAEAERRAALDALLAEVRARPRETLPRARDDS
ncbi:MAG: hypothetical protein LBK23_05055 [Oscillospiraceae bacterium]|jgi:hypothetical protein|nr:hypothetical protein [Oscillospiraceae bacterium]